MINLTRGNSTRFTFDAGQDEVGVWAPDGNSVVFNSNRGGTVFNLYQKHAAGIEPEQLLLQSDHSKVPEHWSADGTMLLYQDVDPKTAFDLWVLPLTGDKKPRPVVRSPFNDMQGRFSPDGHWIAYTSTETGRPEIYVLSFPTAAQRIPISTASGSRPRWRRDGRELFFVTGNPPDAQMMAVDIGVSADGTLTAGLPHKLFDFAMGGGYEAAPDGQRFLMNIPAARNERGAGAPGTLTVIANWQ